MAADTHPLITPRVKKYLTGAGGFDDAAWRAWQVHWFTIGLQAVEARLAREAETGIFCHGDVVSIADICLASILAVMRIFKIAVAAIPTIERIMHACERQTVKSRPNATPFSRPISTPLGVRFSVSCGGLIHVVHRGDPRAAECPTRG